MSEMLSVAGVVSAETAPGGVRLRRRHDAHDSFDGQRGGDGVGVAGTARTLVGLVVGFLVRRIGHAPSNRSARGPACVPRWSSTWRVFRCRGYPRRRAPPICVARRAARGRDASLQRRRRQPRRETRAGHVPPARRANAADGLVATCSDTRHGVAGRSSRRVLAMRAARVGWSSCGRVANRLESGWCSRGSSKCCCGAEATMVVVIMVVS
jgi:hypothetical protein